MGEIMGEVNPVNHLNTWNSSPLFVNIWSGCLEAFIIVINNYVYKSAQFGINSRAAFQRAFSFCEMKKTLGHTVNYGVGKRAQWTGSSDDTFVTFNFQRTDENDHWRSTTPVHVTKKTPKKGKRHSRSCELFSGFYALTLVRNSR